MTDAPKFIHLRVRSALSLLQSMIRPAQLALWAKEAGAPAVGVTDDNLFAALELSEVLSEIGVQPIVGLTLRIAEQGVAVGEIALLAQSEAGYLNLMELSSASFLASVRRRGICVSVSTPRPRASRSAMKAVTSAWVRRPSSK